MSTPAKRAVIFDFDGVIADSWKLHESCWREVLKRHDATLDDDAIVKAVGWNSLETARELIKEADIKAQAEELADEKVALFLERAAKELPVMPGAVDALNRLKPEFQVAVTAGRAKKLVAKALEQFGLGDVPDLVLTSDDMKAEDELDDLLGLAAERLGLKPGHCVLVDDSRNGILAAKRVGMETIAFDSNPKHEIDYSMADAQIGSLDELQPELVNQVIGGK